MKKNLLNYACCLMFLLAGFNAHAQLPDYSVAPDFTTTDIDGNEVNLYDILDEGKSVILDVYATWCGPCWSYHTTHILEDVYQAYGPAGTDEIVVISVEADASTTVADILGTGGNTLGNWTDGITYPMIDDASIGSLYNVNAYPTFYFICPNRILTQNPRFGTAAEHYARLQDLHCQVPGGTNNAGIISYDGYSEDLFCGTIDFDPSVRVQNLGSADITSANIELYNGGTLVGTTPFEGTLTPFDFADVTLPSFVSDITTDLVINISTVNTVADEDPANNQYNLSFEATDLVVEYEKLNLNLVTDQYGCETYWEIINKDNGEVVASGGNPNATAGEQALGGSCAGAQPAGTYESNATINETIFIPTNGCYEFVMIDDYGDGICCAYGNGSFSLTDANGLELAGGTGFGASQALPFGVERLLSGEGAEQTICAETDATFTFDLGANFEGDVSYAATGEGTVVFDQATAAPGSTVTATVSGLDVAGTYVITITASDGVKVATKDYTIIVTPIPAAATLTEPSNGATMVGLTPTITWEAITGITQYFLEVATDDQFSNIVKTALVLDANTYNLTDALMGNTTYFWRISLSNDCGEAVADPFSFTTEGGTSVGDLNGITVDVQPNPTRGIVNVLFSQPTFNEIDVQVYSIDGKLLQNNRVAEQSALQIDLSNYDNGLYIIKLIDADKALTSKVFLSK